MMGFYKSFLLFFAISMIFRLCPVTSDDIKIYKLPANFSFDAVRIQPDGEIRSLHINGAKRNWDSEEPLAMARPKPRIIGGRQTQIKEVPYQVAFGRYGFGLMCGGSIYNKEWIITAAHCFFKDSNLRPKSTLYITAGDYDLSRSERTEQPRNVTAYFIQDDYTPNPGFFDIALIKLDKPLVYTDAVQPLPLGPAGGEYPAKGDAVISGWGYTKVRQRNMGYEQTFFPKRLRSTTIHVYTRAECNEIYDAVLGLKRYANHPGFLCAGETEGGKDPCQGDSGGPLQCLDSAGKKYLCGIVSTGVGCGLPKLPGFFTITAKFVEFIKKHAGEGDQPTIPY